MKRLCADDSAGSRVKVGHRQAITVKNAQSCDWAFFFQAKFFAERLPGFKSVGRFLQCCESVLKETKVSKRKFDEQLKTVS